MKHLRQGLAYVAFDPKEQKRPDSLDVWRSYCGREMGSDEGVAPAVWQGLDILSNGQTDLLPVQDQFCETCVQAFKAHEVAQRLTPLHKEATEIP